MEPTNEQTSGERPRDLNRAIQFLASALGIGVLVSILRLLQTVSGAPIIYGLIIVIAFFGLLFFLLMKVSAGKKWARILWLVLVLSGLPFAISAYLQEVRVHVLSGTLSIIVLILQMIGTYLLFTKQSNLWFRTRK
jgi:FtsH-binding integral membrane protein